MSELDGERESSGTSNFFRGSNPEKWVSGARRFDSVRARGVKPGVDLLYYSKGQELEYDILLRPGARAEDLRLRFDGAQKLSVNRAGDLLIHTAAGDMVQHRPAVWQQDGAKKTAISAEYALEAKGTVAIKLGKYDRARELVIDPVLTFETYLGGKSDDSATAVAVDASGNVYVAGVTASTDFPTNIGAYRVALNGTQNDAFVAKLNPTGTSLLYSTFLGGSSADNAVAISVDAAGNAYVLGATNSNDFPTTASAQQRFYKGMFLTKLNPTGSGLVYSTYLGGNYSDTPAGIAVDPSGNAYVVGSTYGNFPVTSGAYSTTINRGAPNVYALDAFALKLNAAGSSLVYATYLGGSSSDAAVAVTLDTSNQAYITGTTFSTDFPTSATAFQKSGNFSNNAYASSAFVTCLNPAGSALTFSTYLNGSAGTTPSAIALDAQQSTYVVGQTRSSDFPITTGAFSSTFGGYSEGFLSKINYDGSTLLLSTYLGGSADDTLQAVGVDSSGSIVVAGNTTSSNFPLTPGAFPSVQTISYYSSTNTVPFLTKFNPAGTSVTYSTQFGSGTTSFVYGLALDANGNAVVVGNTISKNLPTTAGAPQRSNPDVANLSLGSAFVSKIDLNATTMCSLSVSANSIAAPVVGVSGTISVTVDPGCPWEASAQDQYYNSSFVTLSSASGVGSGTFSYSVPSNSATSISRSSTIKVGSANISVTQPAGSCTMPNLIPASQAFDSSGGLNSISVQIPSGCYYIPTASAPWIQVSSKAAVNGSSSVYYFVTRDDYASRSGSINIAGTLFPISQTGGGCIATLGASNQTFGAQGGTGVIPLSVSPTNCQWTAYSYVPWIQVANTSGTGAGFSSYSVMPNPGTGSRSGQILIAGQTVTITQSGGSLLTPPSYMINTIAGGGTIQNNGATVSFGGDGGSALGASLNFPSSVAFDAAGNLFIADGGNDRIRKVDASNIISTVAGNGTNADTNDGSLASTASITPPRNLTFDAAGNLYFSAGGYRLRSISPAGVINTLAGNGFSGNPPDGSPALSAIPPISGLAVDGTGAFYLGDSNNSRVRRLSAGTLSYYMGTGVLGFNGDGLAPGVTQVSYPQVATVDSSGALYVIDNSRIRKVSAGKVVTIAGGGTGDGEGVLATSIAVAPQSLAIDAQGNIYFTDYYRVRRITTDGKVNTIAGTGNSSGFGGDGGPAINAYFSNANGIALDGQGNIAIADTGNNRIRLLNPTYSSCAYSLSGNNLSVSQAAGTASITVTTTPNCSWNATSNASWITVTASGTGSGTASLSYTANGATPRTGTLYLAGQLVTVSQTTSSGAVTPGPTKVGIMQTSSAVWAVDSNNNGGFDAGDKVFSFLASPGDIAVVGDWTGDGKAKAGIYRNGFWALDINNNGVWDGPSVDRFIAFGGQSGAVPIVGDWNGDGRAKVGLYLNGFWVLDTNGNGVFDSGDQFIAFGGNPGEQPVLGDWNGDGRTKVGILYNGLWALDYNGNGQADAGDKFYNFPYAPGDKAVVGDWNGTHTTKIGIYRAGFWIIDYNGNGVWDGPTGGDRFSAFGGNVGEIPVVGDWNGSGTTKIGYYYKGFWGLDYNGNGMFDANDRFFGFGGAPGEQLVIGAW